MTGAFIRVQRDGKSEDIEVEHLTEAERREFFTTGDLEVKLRWIEMLCSKLRAVELRFQLQHRPEAFRDSPLSE